MTSKVFFKGKVAPTLVQRFSNANRSIEVWETTCIVTNFGKLQAEGPQCNILINPANPQLSGVRNFSYFPKGGPVPDKKVETMHNDWQPLGHVSYWGGMDTSRGILFPVSVVDGMVHQLGGWRLRMECEWIAWKSRPHSACPSGQAVSTSAGGSDLSCYYDKIIHTATPFSNSKFNASSDEPTDVLRECYRNSFATADASNIYSEECNIACPLLGAGARGFTEDGAIKIAAEECVKWMQTGRDRNDGKELSRQNLAVGLLEVSVADKMISRISEVLLE